VPRLGIDRRPAPFKGEHLLFLLGVLGPAIHVVDHQINTDEELAWEPAILTAILVISYLWLPRVVRGIGAILIGLAWGLGGLTDHIANAIDRGFRSDEADYSALVQVPGGILLVGLGIAILMAAWRARSRPPESPPPAGQSARTRA
jgi:hypothetical protein